MITLNHMINTKRLSIIFLILLIFNLWGNIGLAQTDETQFLDEINLEDYSLDDYLFYQEPIGKYYEKAEVMEIKNIAVEESEESMYFDGDTSAQEVKLRIFGGKFDGQEKTIENNLLFNPLAMKFEEGDKVLVFIEEYEGGEFSVYIQDFWRLPYLLGFVGLFILLLIIIGGKKGAKAVLGLGFSIIIIFEFLIPRILDGGNPVTLTLMIASIVTVVTLLLVGGLEKKTYAAMIGTIGGVAVAMVLAMLAGNIANLTGLASEESRLLYSNFPDINLKGLLFAGIMIGALGAVMDVGMSIASSISEIKKIHPKADFKKLVSAGFNVGRDILGTMTNTLIFAYVGVSLPLLLLFTELGESYLKFLNFEFIAEEIIRSMAGSIGLLAALPITALVAAYFENRKDSEDK